MDFLTSFSSHAPDIEITNIVLAFLLGTFFYIRHREKYEALLIMMLGIMVGVLVRYFLEKQIGIGAGFGLFGLFSLMRFSTRFEKMSFLYLFVSLALWILSSLMQAHEIGAFLAFGVWALVVIVVVEIFVKNEETLEIRLPEADLVRVKEIFHQTIPQARLMRVRIPEIKDGNAVVQIGYIRK